MDNQIQSNVTEPLAIWSLVLGILSWFPLGPIAAIHAIVCGHIARRKIKESNNTLAGDGMALAGLILGYLIVALTILMIFIVISAVLFGISLTIFGNPIT